MGDPAEQDGTNGNGLRSRQTFVRPSTAEREPEGSAATLVRKTKAHLAGQYPNRETAVQVARLERDRADRKESSTKAR